MARKAKKKPTNSKKETVTANAGKLRDLTN